MLNLLFAGTATSAARVFAATLFMALSLASEASKDAPTPPGSQVRIVLLGDSTVMTYISGPREFYGWGHFLEEELGPGFKVFNHAAAGRSSKSFWNEKRVGPAMKEKPDIVIVQFGHNDEPGKGEKSETNPNDTYREYLRLYLRAILDAGAKPVFVTPVVRRIYYSDGRLDNSKLRPYAEAMIAVAKEEKIPCFDLNRESFRFFEELGSAKSAKMNAGSGGADFTHFNAEGAKKITAMVATFLRQDMPEAFKVPKDAPLAK